MNNCYRALFFLTSCPFCKGFFVVEIGRALEGFLVRYSRTFRAELYGVASHGVEVVVPMRFELLRLDGFFRPD